MLWKIKQKQKRGFTLIELLVVISIISLLSSIVMASINSARVKARDIARKRTTLEVQNALALYYNQNGNYPAGYYSTFAWGNWSTFTNALAPYISTIQTDPQGLYDSGNGCSSTGNDLTTRGMFFVSSSDGQHYFLGTSLESPSTSDPHYFYKGTTVTTVDVTSSCVAAAHWFVQQ